MEARVFLLALVLIDQSISSRIMGPSVDCSIKKPGGDEMPAPTTEQYAGFQATFDYFNKRLFDSKLTPCMLILGRKGRSDGHFTPTKWQKSGETVHQISVHQISVNPDVIGG